jgi:hypothetical protein
MSFFSIMEPAPPRPGLPGRAAARFLRAALALSFAVSLSDRFGAFGPYGAKGVSWGDWSVFVAFSAKLTFWMPGSLRLAAAWTSTIAEFVLGLGLLVPGWTSWAATGSGLLLALYAASLAGAYGWAAPFDYSVWTASGAAFYLAAMTRRPKR